MLHRAPTFIDRRRITLTISPMWFSTGKPHPLASEPKLEISVTGAAAHNLSDTEVIGDYILYWVGAPMYSRTHEGTLCSIYLVAWKEGWVSEVRLCPTLSTPPRYQPRATKRPCFFPPLASLLPSRDVRLGVISTIRRYHPTDSTT